MAPTLRSTSRTPGQDPNNQNPGGNPPQQDGHHQPEPDQHEVTTTSGTQNAINTEAIGRLERVVKDYVDSKITRINAISTLYREIPIDDKDSEAFNSTFGAYLDQLDSHDREQGGQNQQAGNFGPRSNTTGQTPA